MKACLRGAYFPPSRESDSIGLAGSIDSAAPTARRHQMTRRETPTVFPTIGVFLLLCANKNGPDSRRGQAGGTHWSACMKNGHRVSQVVNKPVCSRAACATY